MATVLVVDDDPKFLQAVENLLSAAGYDVRRAANGAEAIDCLEKERGKIALAIVDLALPDLNGFELIGAISRRANTVKVIATTAIYKDAHLEMAATVGAHAALRKPQPGSPLPQREWLDTVQRLIGLPAVNKGRSAGS